MISSTYIRRIVAGLLVLTLVVQAQEPRGTPGVDYPSYVSIPKTSFSCSEQQYIPGFYADLETQCQVFHFCLKNRQESFLCPTGTIFNQAILACDFWYKSNCTLAPLLYSTNSGPLLETARRSLPILIKLRNRAQIKSLVTPAANVYDKITSLYDSNTGAVQSEQVETSNAAEDVGPKTDSEIRESKSDAESQTLKEAEGSQFEGFSPNEGEKVEEPEIYENLEENEQNMNGNLLYDPVTEQYYINYDSPQNDWQQDSDAADDEFYDYETFGQNYDLSARGYNLRSSDEVAYVSTENTIDDVVELQDLRNLETDHQFLKRGWNEGQSKRVRRKPIYTVIREDFDPDFESDSGTRYIFRDTDENQSSTESAPADSDSSTVTPVGEEASSERTVEITNEMRIPNYTPLNASEVPLTSEEFEHAILRELVEPKIDEHDFKVIGASHPAEQEQAEESTGDASSYQSDEGADNETPGNYESYPDEKDEIIIVDELESVENDDDDIIIVDDQEPDADMNEEKGTDEIIIVDEPESVDADENAVDESKEKMLADDTYVVIPDESDVGDSEVNENEKFLGDSGYYNVESGERNEPEDQNDYEDLKKYCLSNYGCSEAYASIDPSQAQNPQFYYPGQYEAQNQYVSEEYYNPAFRSPVEYSDPSSYAEAAVESGQEYPNYAFAQADSSREAFVDPGSYSYEQPTNYAGYMYGAQNGYPYGGYYGNAYVGENSQNFGYDASESEVSPDFPVNEVPDEVAYNTDYSQASIPTDSSERLRDTDGGVQPEVPDMSKDEILSQENGLPIQSVSGEEGNSAIPSMNKDETYYVFDFEGENEKMGVDPQSTEELAESNASQAGLEESSQTDYSWQSNDSGSPQSSFNVGDQSSEADISFSEDVKSEGSESVDNEESKLPDTWSLQRTESDVTKAVASSTLERLSNMNANSPISSDTSNIHLPSDQFSSNKVHPSSRDFGSYSVPSNANQQFRGAGSVRNKEMNDYSSRSGTPTALKLSAIQERIRSLKQGKFGAFKKLVSSTGSKDGL